MGAGIDVIIPAYNCESTIRRTLASLVAQTDQDFKVYVIDDCSPNSKLMKPIIESFKDMLDLTYYRKDTNEGVGMARQTGYDISTNDWVCFIDADDAFTPYAIEIFKDCTRSNKDIYCTSFFNVRGHKVISYRNQWTWIHGKLYKRDALNKWNIRWDIDHSRHAEDAYFNALCEKLLVSEVVCVPTYCWIDTSSSLTHTEDFKKAIHTDRILDKYMNDVIKRVKELKGPNTEVDLKWFKPGIGDQIGKDIDF